jgi:hypothetical protein
MDGEAAASAMKRASLNRWGANTSLRATALLR